MTLGGASFPVISLRLCVEQFVPCFSFCRRWTEVGAEAAEEAMITRFREEGLFEIKTVAELCRRESGVQAVRLWLWGRWGKNAASPAGWLSP